VSFSSIFGLFLSLLLWILIPFLRGLFALSWFIVFMACADLGV
jgi:hypothetical protein